MLQTRIIKSKNVVKKRRQPHYTRPMVRLTGGDWKKYKAEQLSKFKINKEGL
jgi:hypothetical protein